MQILGPVLIGLWLPLQERGGLLQSLARSATICGMVGPAES